jgi:hypothetical protein
MKLYWHPAMSLAKLNKILVIWMKVYWHPAMQVMYKVVLVFSFISKLPNVARGHQKIREPSRLLGTWYLAVFQKNLGTKLFIFTVNYFFTLFFFYLVLALESISRVKSWLFSQTPLNIIFSQKLSNCHVWRKDFFPFVTNFFFIHIKVAQCCEGSPKK